MKTGRRFVGKWMVLTVSLSVAACPVLESALGQEGSISETFPASAPPVRMQIRTTAALHPFRYWTQKSLAAYEDKTGRVFTVRNFLPSGYEFEPIEPVPVRMAGAPSFYRSPVIKPIEHIPRKGSTQPLLGLGWDHDAGGRKKWNIAFGFGFYFANYHDWRYPPDDFGLNRPGSANRPSDLFDKLRTALEVVGFQVRYDF